MHWDSVGPQGERKASGHPNGTLSVNVRERLSSEECFSSSFDLAKFHSLFEQNKLLEMLSGLDLLNMLT